MSHKNYRKETNCLNCGAEVTGKFCSNCGQENLDTHENFFHVAGHFVSDIFHYDSKFFSSIIPLFTKPGFLTKEYWEGRRVRYIHPLRLFFFVTIVFVLASGWFFSHFRDELLSGISIMQDPNIARINDSYLSTLNDSTKLYVGEGYDSLTVREIKAEKARPARLVGKLSIGADTVFKGLKYVTFFLLPVYAFLFKILYRRKKLFYVDHLVYVLHVQSFMYVALSFFLILPLAIAVPLLVIRTLIFATLLLYLVFSLRYLYKQALWKTILKSVIASFLLFFITIMTVLSIAAFDAIFIQP